MDHFIFGVRPLPKPSWHDAKNWAMRVRTIGPGIQLMQTMEKWGCQRLAGEGVVPKNALSTLRMSINAKERTLSGDPEFGHRFIMTATDEPIARAWLDDQMREMLASPALAGYELTIAHGTVGSVKDGGSPSAVEIEQGARLVAALVERAYQLPHAS